MGILSGVNLAAALSQTIFGGSTHADAKRVPMVFTSTRRLRLYDPSFKSLSTFFTPTESSQGTANRSYSGGGELAPGETGQYGVLDSLFASVGEGRLIRTGTGEMPIIEMAVNPNSITWKQPKRFTKRDTQEGSVFFHFTNSKGENNDILTMDFRGNTGNINLYSSVGPATGALSTAQGNDTGAAKKSLIWHNLWALTREQMLLDDGTTNEFMIMYNSPIIPEEIMLIGFFSNTLDWTDTADKPFSKDYSMSFTVQQIVPPLNELMNTISSVAFNPDEAGNLI